MREDLHGNDSAKSFQQAAISAQSQKINVNNKQVSPMLRGGGGLQHDTKNSPPAVSLEINKNKVIERTTAFLQNYSRQMRIGMNIPVEKFPVSSPTFSKIKSSK